MAANTPRLGRPPASSSAETRGRIIDVARRCFADHGYEATTNRMMAEEAGLTTAAMYHYFDSKLAIYTAVLDEVQERVYHVFEMAEQESDTFVGKLDAVYRAAHDLNRADVSVAQFLGSSRIDRVRNPELDRALGGGNERSRGFFEAIVEHGVETGELRPADQAMMASFIRAFSVGLTDGLSTDDVAHRQAIEGFMAAVRGFVQTSPSPR